MSKARPLEKRHHYLPQCYLANFIAPGESTLVVYDRASNSSRRQTPINTGVEGHLYTVLDPDGEADTSIETDLLGPIDSAIAPVLKRWITTDTLPLHDRSIMASFLAASHTRVPRNIRLIRELIGGLITKLYGELAGDPSKFRDSVTAFNQRNPENAIHDAEELRQLFLLGDKGYKTSVDRTFAMLNSLTVTKDIEKLLLEMNWMLIKTQMDSPFVTSDAPLCVFSRAEGETAIFGAGFGLESVEVSFPLDSTTLLFLTRRKKKGVPTPRELNRRMVFTAERFVISSTESRDTEQMVKEFAYGFGAPRIDYSAIETEEGPW